MSNINIENHALPLEVWRAISQFVPVATLLPLSSVNKILRNALAYLVTGREDEIRIFFGNYAIKKKGDKEKLPNAIYSILFALTLRKQKLSKEVMAGFIARSPLITSLFIQNCTLKFSPLYNVLRDFYSLAILDLSKSGIKDSDLSDFGQFTTLSSLNLTGNKEIRGWCFKWLPSSLKVLCVAKCSIMDDSLSYLALLALEEVDFTKNRKVEDLSCLPTSLTSLNLSKTHVNDDQTSHLSRLTRLLVLDISCNVDRIFGEEYNNWPTSLTSLNIKNNYIDPDYFESDIKRRFTQLKAIYYNKHAYWL
jgi:hypothetical protein